MQTARSIIEPETPEGDTLLKQPPVVLPRFPAGLFFWKNQDRFFQFIAVQSVEDTFGI